MDDERWEPGMPVLDRQAIRTPAGPVAQTGHSAPTGHAGQITRAAPTLPPSLQGLPRRSVPEAVPTPLQPYYINLSVIVLIFGAIAITALELGAPLSSPLVKLCILVATPLLIVTTVDAVVRIWRSAWAWMPVDRTRGTFRLAWVAVSLIGLGALVIGATAVLLG